MKALVIGAGRVGASAAYRLHNLEYDVTVRDPNEQALDNPLLKGCDLDRSSRGVISNTFDYVVNCGPWLVNADTMVSAVNAKAHYFDVSEDPGAITMAKNLASAKDYETAIVPACGFAPGFVSIMADSMAERWLKADKILIYVGALPINIPTNKLRHELAFSAEGLVNMYTKGSDVLAGGVVKRAKPLMGYEQHVDIGGQMFEAFITAGGLGTLPQTWEGRADTVLYKTIRWIGHYASLGALVTLLPGRQDLIKAFNGLERAAPGYDMVVAKIVVEGQWGFDVWERTYTYSSTSDGRIINGELTIARMTAASVCAMVELHADGKIPEKGFVAQEVAKIDDFLATQSGAEFS